MQEADPNRLWYVYSVDKEIGPIKEVELRHRILSGTLLPNSHAYTDGMADWRALSEIKGIRELFTAEQLEAGMASTAHVAEKNGKSKRKPDRARYFLAASFVLFASALVYYYWDPTAQLQLADHKTDMPALEAPQLTSDPFTQVDWAKLRAYRARKDVVGSGFVLSSDRIDEEFPVLRGAVSMNISAGEIDYRIYPVPGAHLMPLPKVIYGKTSLVNGYFVIGPLSDSGSSLPIGKYRLIAKAEHIFLGEVTLLRGHMPEGENLQREEEKLKLSRFKDITSLKETFAQKTTKIEEILRDFEKLKLNALNPDFDKPSDFSAQARLALEKFRDERFTVKSMENDLVLLGPTAIELLQMVESLWVPLSKSFQEFPNPDPQRFVGIDTKGIITYLQNLREKVSKVPAEEIVARSESILNEEIIKRTLMGEEASAR